MKLRPLEDRHSADVTRSMKVFLWEQSDGGAEELGNVGHICQV